MAVRVCPWMGGMSQGARDGGVTMPTWMRSIPRRDKDGERWRESDNTTSTNRINDDKVPTNKGGKKCQYQSHISRSSLSGAPHL